MTAEQAARLDAGSDEMRALANALREHCVLLFRNAHGLTPEDIRNLYWRLHEARFPSVPIELPPSRPVATAGSNLRGSCFPGHPETNGSTYSNTPNLVLTPITHPTCATTPWFQTLTHTAFRPVLGFAKVVTDWHGLTGSLKPTAWWERGSGQYHHDGYTQTHTRTHAHTHGGSKAVVNTIMMGTHRHTYKHPTTYALTRTHTHICAHAHTHTRAQGFFSECTPAPRPRGHVMRGGACAHHWNDECHTPL